MMILKKNIDKKSGGFDLLPKWWRLSYMVLFSFAFVTTVASQGTRLLRQPTISTQNIAFTYGGDLWIADINGGEAQRLTSTDAVESNPHFSPDG
jgi:tricorn protease